MLNRVVGGWEVTGYGRVTSGRPFTAFAGTNTVSNVNQSTANCTGCGRGDGSPFLDSASGLIWFFDAAERAKFSAPGAGQFGNTGRNYFVGPHYFEMDASLLKRVAVTERVRLEFRGDATNLTNSEFRRADHGHHQLASSAAFATRDQQLPQDPAGREDSLLARLLPQAAPHTHPRSGLHAGQRFRSGVR